MPDHVERTFWDAPSSANAYKVRPLMHLIDIPHERVRVTADGAEPDARVREVHRASRVQDLPDPVTMEASR